MIALLFALNVLQTAAADAEVELCKRSLARKVGGDIATIDVSSSHVERHRRTIEGRLTAFSRMGPAPAGTARTHHLGRFEFTFRCQVRGGRVRKARITPLGA